MTQPYTEEWVKDGPQKTAFYTRTYSPPEGTPIKAGVIFVHGFIEHIARYNYIFPIWAAGGISVFSYDQRGFGLTATDKENKSSHSSWGVTSWTNQQEDIAFFISRERTRLGAGVPLFLVGHSMGGAESLGFAVTPPTTTAALTELTGIVASSPLIRQASAESPLKIWLGAKAAKLLPSKLVDTPVKSADLSHDPEINKAYDNDPLVRPFGSLRGVADMLNQGIALAETNYKNWPVDLPLLLLHGDQDKVTSHTASEKFFTDITAKDKHISVYNGGYHELANEPDGVKEKWANEVLEWILKHATASEQPKL